MGIGMLTAGLILAIMVIPFIAAVMRDVFEIVPPVLKESAYALGATTWEVVWHVVLPYTRVGVVGGIMLGLGRALGETMAVTFVIGNAHELSASLFMPGNTISSDAGQRVHRGGRRPVHLVADRAGADPVRHHLHRARPLQAAAASGSSARQGTATLMRRRASGPASALYTPPADRQRRSPRRCRWLATAIGLFGSDLDPLDPGGHAASGSATSRSSPRSRRPRAATAGLPTPSSAA